MSPDQSPAKRRGLRLIVLGLLVVGGWALWRTSQSPISLPHLVTASQPGLYYVSTVDDGDTIRVQLGTTTQTVRLIGMDTPEVKDPRKPVQCYGAEASAQTKSMVLHQRVRLVADSVGDNRDKYGRLLRYVYLPNGTLLNEYLVQHGYAFAYVIFPFDKLEQFKQDEVQAKVAGLGLWSKCQVDSSSDIKQTNPI